LKEYVEDNLNLDAYDVVFDYSPAELTAQKLPLAKSVIHFAIDDIQNPDIGYGATTVEAIDANTLTPSELLKHDVNFDVGMWASASTGGSTARLVVYQHLVRLFQGKGAYDRCMEATDGVEIISFNGGRFYTDRINDLEIYRIVGAELVVRCYSAETGALESGYTPYTIEQEPDLTIQEEVIVIVP
jgi:hypothetical protein